MTWHGTVERAPTFDPRYQGSVKSYPAGDYPNVESIYKSLCCFKTNMHLFTNWCQYGSVLGFVFT